MKFLADMGISPETVRFTCQVGYEAVHLHEESLDRMVDSDILSKARREDRIVLTSDLDFGELIAVGGHQLPSVIIFRLKDMRPTNVNRYLKVIFEQHAEDLNAGAILSVTEKRIRVRRLPIQR